MGYLHIENLYKAQDILMLKQCYALEKIHGTSAHLTWKDGKIHFSSGGASFQAFVVLFDEEKLTKNLRAWVGESEPAVIYGEAFGGKLMGMSKTYGVNLQFVVFDIKINELWLNVPMAETLTKNLGLDFVPYKLISTELEEINKERDADSEQAIRSGVGPGKIREGVVLRPLIELRKNNNERLISKHKREEFRETVEVKQVEPGNLKVIQDAEAAAQEFVTEMRLIHVLDKLSMKDQLLTMKDTLKVKNAILEDVMREAKGEIPDTPEVRKAIGTKAAEVFRVYLKRMW